jgi:Ca2+-binding EF-hand superfamily protein
MLGYSIVLVFGLFGFSHSNKVAANSPQGIAVNVASLGSSDTVMGVAEPYFPGVPEDIQKACAKMEKPDEQFSRVTEQKNDSIDFSQFLQLDSCGTAWRKHDFIKIDTNNDSRISAEEWKTHNDKLKKELEEAILSQRNFTFSRIDSNKDGQLSKKELTKYLEERSISSSNLTSYLNGSQLNFEQFVDFDSTIPNATFSLKIFSPIYDYSVPLANYDYDAMAGEPADVEIHPQPRPAFQPQARPAILPAINIMPVNVVSPPKKDGEMNIQIEPPQSIGAGVAKPQILPFPQPKVAAPEGSMSAAVMPH